MSKASPAPVCSPRSLAAIPATASDPDDFDPDGRPRRRECLLGAFPWGTTMETIYLKCINELVETLAADYMPGFDDETRRGFKIAHALVNRPAMRHAVLTRHAWAYSHERLHAFLWFHEAMCADEARLNQRCLPPSIVTLSGCDVARPPENPCTSIATRACVARARVVR